jgi:ribosomal protein L19
MSSIAYDKLDNLISSSGLKWEDIVSCYSKDCKTIEVKKGVHLNAENLLYYIRAMSRIILDYEFQ